MVDKTGGWIKVHRKSLQSTVFQDINTWKVWCWCLLRAGHEKVKFRWNGKDMELNPGQFITGTQSALAELNPKRKRGDITRQKLRTCINYLKSTNRITVNSTNKFTIITVEKWKEYQEKPTSKLTTKSKTKQPTSNHKQELIRTNKEDKEAFFIFSKNERPPTNVKFYHNGNDMAWRFGKWQVKESGGWMDYTGNFEDQQKNITSEIK